MDQLVIRNTKTVEPKNFGFDKNNVHITGYYPNENVEFEKDFSGFSKPIFVTEHSKTF